MLPLQIQGLTPQLLWVGRLDAIFLKQKYFSRREDTHGRLASVGLDEYFPLRLQDKRMWTPLIFL